MLPGLCYRHGSSIGRNKAIVIDTKPDGIMKRPLITSYQIYEPGLRFKFNDLLRL